MEDRYRERPNVRRLSSRRRRDEFDDIFADDEPAGRPTTVLRPVGGSARRQRPLQRRARAPRRAQVASTTPSRSPTSSRTRSR